MILTPLQQEACDLLAQGVSAPEVRTRLDLSLSTFENWRNDANFADAVTKAKKKLADDADREMQQNAEIHFFGGQR